MLIEIMNCEELSEQDKNDLIEKVKELTADELNHQNVLQEIYVSLTTIQPKID
jgi:phenylpyruvate tautomerase PptA (4-oxalocrotonate tautomerase family)